MNYLFLLQFVLKIDKYGQQHEALSAVSIDMYCLFNICVQQFNNGDQRIMFLICFNGRTR